MTHHKECSERTDRLPSVAGHEKIAKEVRAAKTPTAAASIVARYTVEDAVAVIDNLDPLTAAIVFDVFSKMADGYPSFLSVPRHRSWMIELVTKAKDLRIRGTLGIIHARDEVCNKTDYPDWG